MSLRTKIEADWFGFFDDMDPSGKNTERLKQFLKPMTDKQFYTYAEGFFAAVKKNFALSYDLYDNDVTMDLIYSIEKKHKIDLFEYVFKPWMTMDKENPPGTAEKVMVLDIPLKRLKQMTQIKNHTTVNGTHRDGKTGQMSGHDKTARATDVDTYSLIVHEQYSAAQEYYGPLSDDEGARFAMLRAIARDGEVSINDLPTDTLNRVTMNTVDYMMKGVCISTNLIDESGYLLPATIKAREDRLSAIKR